MSTERTEVRVTEAVEAVRPEFTPALRQRAMAAIEAVAPTPACPPWRARSRRRWIAVAAGAAAVLIGLGFVPLPAGRTHGVLARAMATLDAGPNIHVIARGWSGEEEYRIEEWSAADGSMRYERWVDGELSYLLIEVPERSLRYYARERAAYEDDEPPMPDRRQIITSEVTREGLQSTLAFVQEHLDGSVSERRERSLWSGTVDVIEAEGKVAVGTVISGVPYDDPGIATVRAEVDPQTNRVLSLRESLRTEEGQRLMFETEAIEWDVEIPASAWEFTPPAGTKVERHTWWAGRADKQLAAADTGDWRVVVHTIDVNRTGDVVLTISGWLPEGDPGGIEVRPRISEVQAVDDRGCHYSQDSRSGCSIDLTGGYWVTTLHPDPAWKEAALPSTITLTIGSSADTATGHPPVTFRDLPLPARQQADDLFKAATEVVQY